MAIRHRRHFVKASPAVSAPQDGACHGRGDDPAEKRNLSTTRPEVLARMVSQFDARLREDMARGPAPTKPIDEERMQLLRELHYVK